MRTIDFTPVFRSTVGFDRMARLVDAALSGHEASGAPSFPPYNIERLGEDNYRISMAVAGFGEQDIDVTVRENTLYITGKVEKPADDKAEFLYRGIAERAFERRFQLADFIKVKGAALENGLLHVELVREVPEEAKPRKIAIGNGAPKLTSKAA